MKDRTRILRCAECCSLMKSCAGKMLLFMAGDYVDAEIAFPTNSSVGLVSILSFVRVIPRQSTLHTSFSFELF